MTQTAVANATCAAAVWQTAVRARLVSTWWSRRLILQAAAVARVAFLAPEPFL